jgi:hypothetical protein
MKNTKHLIATKGTNTITKIQEFFSNSSLSSNFVSSSFINSDFIAHALARLEGLEHSTLG